MNGAGQGGRERNDDREREREVRGSGRGREEEREDGGDGVTEREGGREIITSWYRRNTAQHTATHHNALQHTATHCNTRPGAKTSKESGNQDG